MCSRGTFVEKDSSRRESVRHFHQEPSTHLGIHGWKHVSSMLSISMPLSNFSEQQVGTRKLSIIRALLHHPSLASQVEFFGINFRLECESINQFQGRIELVSAVAINNCLGNQLNFEAYRTRLDQILSNNPDFDLMSNYSKIIAGENIENISDEKLNAENLNTQWSPVKSKEPFLSLRLLKLITGDN